MLWLDATNAATIEQGYKDIAATIRGPDDSQMSLDAARALLASLREEWLLLVDGADDAEAMSGLWPPGRYGDILYTSRNPVLKDFTSDAVCEVSEMEDDDAVELLLDAARLKPAPDAVKALAATIVAELGHLALAVDQAGAYIACGECRVYDFLDTFERHRASLLSVDAYNRASPYKRAVYATWELSYSAIQRMSCGEIERDPQVEVARNAIQLLNMLAFFHYEHMTEDIFRRAAEDPSRGCSYPPNTDPFRELAGDEDLPDSLLPLNSGMKWDAHPFRRCVRLLSSYSLLWANQSSEAISMHRLVHRWAFDRLAPNGRRAALRSSAATLAGSATIEYDLDGYTFSRRLLPHILALFRQAAIQHVNPLRNADQMERMSTVLDQNGRWSHAVPLLRRALTLKEKLLGCEHREALYSMGRLAQALRQQGQAADAEALQRQEYDIRRRVLGPEHPGTL